MPDGPKCVCGHGVRYQFVIRHKVTGKTENICSVCIKFVELLSPELYQQLQQAYQKLLAEIAEHERQLKQQKEYDAFLRLEAEYKQLYQRFQDVCTRFRVARKQMPHQMYKIFISCHKDVVMPVHIKEMLNRYKRLSTVIHKLQKGIDVMTSTLGDMVSDDAAVDRAVAAAPLLTLPSVRSAPGGLQ